MMNTPAAVGAGAGEAAPVVILEKEDASSIDRQGVMMDRRYRGHLVT